MKKVLAAFAVLLAAAALSGCMRHYSDAEYQKVIDEVSYKYNVTLKVDLDGNYNITPDQLRAHLEAVAMEARQAA
ncbi:MULTISPECIES: hypothetical protein [Anaerotruncus]|uniref:hypothetical protein n=1 Tax=Anaerotruncus TaxID=244127 RepID=UPI000829A9FD|nr:MULTISPECIES: hypothetical protein [Anaerotruncus]RGX55383.1 hypothetical protein DWV16_09170 [Anaerotruncus sp. AF02-27]